MKKGKKIWNRLLSLVLCLVMVTGMFAGMGMEAKASISLYPKDFTVTAVDYGGNPIDTDCAHIEVTGYFYYAGVDSFFCSTTAFRALARPEILPLRAIHSMVSRVSLEGS